MALWARPATHAFVPSNLRTQAHVRGRTKSEQKKARERRGAGVPQSLALNNSGASQGAQRGPKRLAMQ
jgi:hypothetical protein